jgi:hypothetical protein
MWRVLDHLKRRLLKSNVIDIEPPIYEVRKSLITSAQDYKSSKGSVRLRYLSNINAEEMSDFVLKTSIDMSKLYQPGDEKK